MAERMYIAVVTGAMGAGKSEAVRYLKTLGAYVISLDEIGHMILADDPQAREEIEHVFGSSVLDADGNISRKRLAKLAFSCPEQSDRLNEIMHPRIIARAEGVINSLSSPCIEGEGGPEMVVVEVPLPEKARELLEAADEIVCIDACENVRRERLLERGLSEADIDARVLAQMPAQGYLDMSDTRIQNNSGLPELHNALEYWYRMRVAR